MLCHHSTRMMANLLRPIYKDVFGSLQRGFVSGLASNYGGKQRKEEGECGIEI